MVFTCTHCSGNSPASSLDRRSYPVVKINWTYIERCCEFAGTSDAGGVIWGEACGRIWVRDYQDASLKEGLAEGRWKV